MNEVTAESLLRGVAVVIDDKIHNKSSTDLIQDIINQIVEKKIPILKFTKLPSIEEIKHFSEVSFILIDWNLISGISDQDMLEGVVLGDAAVEIAERENIDFILRLKELYFGPVFIFSRESEDTIHRRLIEGFSQQGVHEYKDLMSYIFIKNKNELTGNRLFEVLNGWFDNSPAMYVLKQWDNTFSQVKTDFFWHFYSMDHNWPTIFWKIFKKDVTNPSYELSNLISKNFFGRVIDCKFKEELILKSERGFLRSDIRKLLSGERYVNDCYLCSDTINCGDLFFEEETNKFYINIRPDCDCIPRNGKIGNVELYLLKGTRISEEECLTLFDRDYSNFREKINFTIIPFIEYNGEIIHIKFKLRDLIVKKHKDLTKDTKAKRIGKILPPYITQIRLKYTAYLQREGFIPTPYEAIFNDDEMVDWRQPCRMFPLCNIDFESE